MGTDYDSWLFGIVEGDSEECCEECEEDLDDCCCNDDGADPEDILASQDYDDGSNQRRYEDWLESLKDK